MVVLDSMLKDWKISEKVCGVITDNGSNIVNATGLMEKSNTIHAFHTLCSCPLKWTQCFKGTVSSWSVLEAG